MWNLDPRKYSSVYLKKHPITPWIVPQENLSELCQAGGLLKVMLEDYKEFHDTWAISWAQEHFQRSSVSLSPEEAISALGLQTHNVPGSTFLNKKDFDDREKSADLVLPAEKFFSKPFMTLGSSRHALAGNFQLKGIGRNSLCLDEDYYHSWGGWSYRDALKAFFADRLAHGKSELGSLKLLGVFLYKNVPEGFPPLAMAVREADSYRLCQLEESFLTNKEVKLVKDFLDQRFSGKSPQNILALIFKNYLAAYKNGVIHRSPNKDNLLIDGRWIDSESLDCATGGKSIYPFLRIFVPEKMTIESAFQKSLSSLALNDVHFYDSWVHHLRLMCELTFDTYRTIYGDVFGEFKSLFDEIFTTTFPGSLSGHWKKTLDHLSYNEMTFCHQRESELSPLKDFTAIQNAVGDFRCIAIHYDPLLKGTVLNFAPADEDIHFTMNKIVKKLEASFWPADFSLDQAIENAAKITAAVKGMIS